MRRFLLTLPLLSLLALASAPARAGGLIADVTPGSTGTWQGGNAYGAPMHADYVGGFYYLVSECNVFRMSGDPGNVTLVKQVAQSGPDACDGHSLGRLGNRFIFSMNNSEVWSTDGTGPGTVKLPITSGNLSFAHELSWNWPRFPGWMFIGYDFSSNPTELWLTDGTVTGTRLVQMTGSTVSVGFLANGDAALIGDGLWRMTDPEDTPAAVTTTAFTGGRSPFYGKGRDTKEARSRLFFMATTAAAGEEIWSTDLTLAGTSILVDHTPGMGSTLVKYAGAPYVDGHFYFTSNDQLYHVVPGSGASIKVNPAGTGVQGAPFPIGGGVSLMSVAQGTGYSLWTLRDAAPPAFAPTTGDPGVASSPLIGWTARWPDRAIFGVPNTAPAFNAYEATPLAAPANVSFTGLTAVLGGGELSEFRSDHYLVWSAFTLSLDWERNATTANSIATDPQNSDVASLYFARRGGPMQLFTRPTLVEGREPWGIDLATVGVPMCNVANFELGDNASVSDSLHIRTAGTIAGWRVLDARVHVKMRHSYIGDLTIGLQHVTSGRSITLLERPANASCTGDDLDVIFDDVAATSAATCADGGPAFPAMQSLLPQQPLSTFFNASYAGEWRLTVSDGAGGDIGGLTEWCLDLGVGPVPDRIFRNGLE